MDFLQPRRISRRMVSALILAGMLAMMAITLTVWVNHTLIRLQQRIIPTVTSQLRQMLGRDVRIGSIDAAGFSGLIIHDMAVANGPTFAGGTALTAPRAVVKVNLYRILLDRDAPPISQISSIDILQPHAEVNRSARGRWDFQDILDRLRTRNVTVGGWHATVQVDGGSVHYRDALGLGTGPIEKAIFDVDGRVSPTRASAYAFNLSATDSDQQIGRVVLAGDYTTASGDARIDLRANRVAAAQLTRYLPKNLPLAFTDGTTALRFSAFIRNLPNPKTHLNSAQLTAEMSLKGLGLKLRDMSSPVIATSGTLRLTHDAKRYPHGSRIDLLNVQAHAGSVPVSVRGSVADVDLFDIAHAKPLFDITLQSAVRDGSLLPRLFPGVEWTRKVQLFGRTGVQARLNGRPGHLRVDGSVQGKAFSLPDFNGTDASAQFHLLLDGPRKGGQPTVTATAHIGKASLGNSTVTNLTVRAESVTPWRELDNTPIFSGYAGIGSLQASWGTLTNAKSNFQADKTRVALYDLQGSLHGGNVAGLVSIPFQRPDGPEGRVHAELNFTGIDMAKLTAEEHVNNITGHGNGVLTLDISTRNVITAHATLRDSAIRFDTFDTKALQADLLMTVTGKHVTADILSASAGTKYGHFKVTEGTFAQDPAHGMPATLRLPIASNDVPLSSFGYDKLDGTADVAGVVEGEPHALAISVAAHAGHGSLLGRTFDSATGNVRWQDGKLALKNLRFQRSGMTLALSGGPDGFDPRQSLVGLNGTLTLLGPRVNDVLSLVEQQSPWPVDGGTQGTIQIRYTDQGLLADGAVRMAHPTVHLPAASGDYPLNFDALALNFAYANRQVQIHDLQLDRGKTTMHAQGTAGQPTEENGVQADVAFRGDHAMLEDLPQDLLGIPVKLAGVSNITGTLHGVLNGTGPTPLLVTAKIDTPQLAAEKVPVGHGSVQFDYAYRPQDRHLTIQNGAVENSAFALTTSGQYALDHGMMDGAVAFSRLDLAAIRNLLPASQNTEIAKAQILLQKLSGTGTMQVDVSGNTQHPTAQATFALQNAGWGALVLPQVHGTLTGTSQDGHYQLQINDLAAEGPGGLQAQAKGAIDSNGKLNLALTLPQQSLAGLHTLLPKLPAADGTFGGSVRLAGTMQNPQLTGGDLSVQGNINLPYTGHAFPNRLSDVDLQLQLAGDRVNITRMVATIDRRDNGKRPKNFHPGWVTGAGSVQIPVGALQNPDQWNWDVRTQVAHFPVPAIFAPADVSGLFRLAGNGRPTLTGVVLLDNARLILPDTQASTFAWGPFPFNPRLSLVVQIGSHVKLAKSILRFPLKPTPLALPATPTGAEPTAIVPTAEGFDWNAAMLVQQPGTWGAVTGSLNDPQVQGRFEVDKKKLAFPFSIIGSIRNARGSLTFSMADGVKVVMGDPKPTTSMAKGK